MELWKNERVVFLGFERVVRLGKACDWHLTGRGRMVFVVSDQAEPFVPFVM